MKYYAVKSVDGKIVNKVFTDWDSCKAVVSGHHCVYKSFKTMDEVKKFLTSGTKSEEVKPNAVYYVDGSFLNNGIGWSWVLVKDGNVVRQLYGGVDPNEETSRNITGELQATRSAIKDAVLHKINEIEIVHDYQGISSFIDGAFEAKTKESNDYKNFVEDCKTNYNLKIKFTKVKGHSNNRFNDLADELAKKGANLPSSEVVFYFTDSYDFLDNKFYSPISIKGKQFKCVDDAFKFMKSKAPNVQIWEDKRLEIMHNLLLNKFLQNYKLVQRLMFSRNSDLINTNYWGDDFWGVFNDKGLNMLGELLQLVRDEFNGTVS